jgi:Glycosyl transferase family 2
MKQEPLITILMVNYNSCDFIRLNLKALSRLTKNHFHVLICDNGSTQTDFYRLRWICSAFPNVTLISRLQSSFGSMGHGEALDLLTRYIDTPYGVILDADCIPLIMHWDQLLIDQLMGPIKIIGTPVAHNSPNNVKPTDFPLMFLCLFETKTFKSLGISFKPKDIAAGQDTGWEMREKYLEGGLKGALLHGENTRSYKDGPLSKTICDEYYSDSKRGEIFCSHLGRGSNPNSGKYKSQSNAKKAYALDKQAWLNACEEIIEQETSKGFGSKSLICDLCGSINSTCLFEAPYSDGIQATFWKLMQCNTCTLTFLDTRQKKIPPSSVAKIGSDLSKIPLLSPIRPLGVNCPRLLEIGGGAGSQKEVWKSEGWQVESMEQLPSMPTVIADASYDAVVLSISLGSVRSTSQFLATISPWLKTGGQLLFSCYDTNSWEFKNLGKHFPNLGLPNICFQFSPSTLKRYLFNFRVEFEHHPLPIPLLLNGLKNRALSGEGPKWEVLLNVPNKLLYIISKFFSYTHPASQMLVRAWKK